MAERPAWVERLKKRGKLSFDTGSMPALWYRTVYFIFGYAVLLFGIYLLINGIMYSPYIRLH
jgi:hypothetical protein